MRTDESAAVFVQEKGVSINTTPIKAGDWVMSGPSSWEKASWAQRGIMLTGSVHTHDEVVAVKRGRLFKGNAHSPFFTLDPFEELMDEYTSGARVFAVFRWHEFLDEPESEAFLQFQAIVTACAFLTALRKTPYDSGGITSHARNYLRAQLRHYTGLKLPMLAKHVEYKVFCTENNFETYEVAEQIVPGLNFGLRKLIGRQPLVAPVHAEKLYRMGYLAPVVNFGLTERMGK